MFAEHSHFRTPAAWRAWLRKHGKTAESIVLRLAKKHAAHTGIGYAEALDEALCFGWIDGVMKSHDADTYLQRFTPRKSKSIWSKINLGHMERLIREKRMTSAGLAAFALRVPERTGIYSFEREEPAKFSATQQREFKANARAWKFFDAQPPGYRHWSTHWVVSAKREETQVKRLKALIQLSAAGKRRD